MLSNAVTNVIWSIVFGHRFELDDPQFMFLLQTIDSYFSILSSPLGQVCTLKIYIFYIYTRYYLD